MKVIGINASPRKRANTQTLVEAVLEGAAENGAETRLVNLRELKINGCLGCEGCKKHPGKCVQKDDLTILLQDMTTYDAIVMGTPVYWYHVSAQLKMLVDRSVCRIITQKVRSHRHGPDHDLDFADITTDKGPEILDVVRIDNGNIQDGVQLVTHGCQYVTDASGF